MDYLDPKKKQRKKISLMVMYVLLGVAIAIGTVVVVYLVNGYSIDRQTGEVIQNGLIYLDSKPESADIYLNGEKQRGRTDARLVIPAGEYDVKMSRDGYRDWQRELVLEGGSLRRLTYARLIPSSLDSELALNLVANPTMASQSIDKRWLVMASTENPLQLQVIDLNRNELRLDLLQLPLDLLNTKEAGTWEVIDWADDNKTFLASYTTASTIEYVLIDREDGNRSVKLSTRFPTVIFTEVSLRSRKKNAVYLYDRVSETVYRANTDGTAELVLDKVLDYVSYDDDKLLYVTSEGAEEGMVVVNLLVGNETYKLRSLKQSPNYLLDISKLGSSLVVGIGSPAEDRVIIYKDPVNEIKNNEFSKIPVPITVLRVPNPEELVISADSSVIVARGGQSFASHEFEADRSYQFKLEAPLDPNQKLRWLDGQHISVSSDGVQYIMDFDGSNVFDLIMSDPLLGGFMEKDFDQFYTFMPPVEAGGPSRLITTSMRAAADR